MLRPLELPDTAPEEARERAAEFALGLADVARVLGVSKQTAYTWAREGRVTEEGFRTVLPSLRAPGGKHEPIRFRLPDLRTFAREHQLHLDVTVLPLELQKRLGAGAFDVTLPDRAVVRDELISEVAAARQLGKSRSSLQLARTTGRLNPALTVRGSSYSQIDIFRVIDGELELFGPTAEGVL